MAGKGVAQWVGPVRYRVRGETGYTAFELDGEHYRLGDTVLLKACDEGEDDYVARIESLWEDPSGAKHLEARWYYAPEHTRLGRLRRHHKREVFESTHTDENSLETVQGKCAVLSWHEYRAWASQPVSAAAADEEAERTFVCRGSYNTRTHDIRPLRPAGAEALDEHATAELPLLTDPSAGVDADSNSRFDAATAAAAASAQPPLLGGRCAHNPYADARSCLLLNAPPARLPCRENERDKVLRWMRTAIAEGGTSSPLYISGVPGTGKTATVREVCRLLRAEERRGDLPPFSCAELNGMRLPAATHAYTLLWEVLSAHKGARRESLGAGKALAQLEAHFSHAGAPSGSGGGGGGSGGANGAKRRRPACTVLIADEIDYLVTPNQGLLYNLFEWSSRAHAQLALVGISNTVDLPERLLPRLNSRIGLCRVPFLPYSHAELAHILKARLGELAVFDGSGLELAARKVASVSGDVRRALEICRRATELAEERSAGGADAAPHADARSRGGLSTPRREPRRKGAAGGSASAATSRAGGDGGDDEAPRVLIGDIDGAIRSLQQSAPVRALRRLPAPQQLLLVSAQLEASRTGRGEVPARAVLSRCGALCRQHAEPPFSEQCLRTALVSLVGWRFFVPLAPAAGSAAAMSCSSELDDTLRLGVQPDELRLALRADGVNAIAKAVL